MKILITGGAGFIGLNLVRKLAKEKYEIIVIDNFDVQVHGIDTTHIKQELNKYVKLIIDDISEINNYKDLLSDIEIIYHLASSTGTSQSMYEISSYYRNNVEKFALLFDFVLRNCRKVNKIILSSSRAVYGEGAYLQNGKIVYPLPRKLEDIKMFEFRCSYEGDYGISPTGTPENATLSPGSVYGVTKLLQEEMLIAFAKQISISCHIFRFQNVYGPGQSLSNPYTGVLGVFSNLLIHNMPIKVYENGSLNRDFVFIDDITDVLAETIHINERFLKLNIGSGISVPILDIALILKKYFNSNSNIQVVNEYRYGDISKCYADLSNLKKYFRFNPKTIEEGLEIYVDWVKRQDVKHENLLNVKKSFEEQKKFEVK